MARSTPGERHRPRQDRSAQRVELILDTTAALVDELGYGALSPALIARRSGMSGPAIYRYFTDLESIALALAQRNLERYIERCSQFLAETAEWQDAIAAAIDAYADFFRNEPGFRRIRLGGTIPKDPRGEHASSKQVLAEAVSELFVQQFEVLPRHDLVKHVEVMVELGEALITRAFHNSVDGDPFFLTECARLMVGYLDEYLARPLD